MKIINTNGWSLPTENKDSIEMTAVLTIDERKQYAVYVGVGGSEFIMDHGMKLNHREALSHFPMLEKKEYRR